MLTQRQIRLVKDSWRLFSRINPELAGDVFYGRLFLVAPSTKKLFRNSKTAQYEKLRDMLTTIVAGLEKADKFTADIEAMAQRHKGYGVKPAHYKIVGECLLWTLEKGLGDDWNDDLKEAWVECYQLLSETMLNAA
jgi:hemoglobin-like flavoprotein